MRLTLGLERAVGLSGDLLDIFWRSGKEGAVLVEGIRGSGIVDGER